tara:strand:+ start:720 stop:1133 length:414 start_codon:yes stop_codon:yes gene_type:complete
MNSQYNHIEIGLKFARWGGYLLSLLLLILVLGAIKELTEAFTLLNLVKIIYFLTLSTWINLPYEKLKAATFKFCFAFLCLLSVGFVFLMVVVVMFAYMEAAERGERLGVPGFEGTLIFLALLQVPTQLFRRNPDLLD